MGVSNEEAASESSNVRKRFDAQSIILNHIDQGVVVRDAHGQIVLANIAAAQIFGYSSVEEFAAVPFHVSAQRLPLFDDQGNPFDLERLLKAVVSSVPDNASTLIRFLPTLDQDERWFRIRVRSVPNEAESEVLEVAVWEDVTEQRKAGEPTRLLAAIVATSDDAIVSKTLGGIVTSWNRAAERLYGWSAEEMVGHSIARIVPPDKLEELSEILARLAKGERIDQHETVRVTRDGRRLDVSVSISPLLDNEGRVVGAAKIGRDITLRREAERFTDAFLVDLAHDVNNPLATARIQAQLLRRRWSKPPVNSESINDSLASLAAIEASIEKVARRINELSDVSRLRLHGELELKRTKVELSEVIDSVVRSNPQRERLQIRRAASPLIGTWDFERLERVFDNLVVNALKYSAPGTTVTIEIVSEPTATVPNAVVNVIDSGVGIPEADLPYVFDRFRRGSNVVGRIAGTGIGLAGTRQIVELHGGTVSIESKAGFGTTVTVRLPLQSQ